MNHWLEPVSGPDRAMPSIGLIVPDAVDLVADGAAGAAESVTAGVAVLDHEVGHHPVPAVAVEEPPIDQPKEVGHGERRLGPEQLDLDGPALIGLDEDMGAGHRVRGERRSGATRSR